MSNEREGMLPPAVADEVTDPREREALERVWTALGDARPRRSVEAADRQAMWAAVSAATAPPAGHVAGHIAGHIAPPASSRPTTARSARAGGRGWAVTALAAALLLAAGLALRPGPWEVVQVPNAQVAHVTLPDGTEVDLDAGSTLRHRRAYRGWGGRTGARDVSLEGSGYFDVVRDARPFTVHTYNATVRVLGTAFSVDARAADATGTEVAVAEGSVTVQDREQAAERTLAPGQRTVVTHATGRVTAATAMPVERVAPWRTGGLVAIDAPLAQVVHLLERRFDVRIALAAGDSLGARRVTLYYPVATPLDRILTDLASMQGLRWSRGAQGYVLE